MIDTTADRAVFRQLADILRSMITSGELAPGHQLPSEPQLSQTYGVGRETVRQALTILRSEGLIHTMRGVGTFVRAQEDATIVRLAPSAKVSARMPTETERRKLNVAEGVPLLVVSLPDVDDELYPADRVVLLVPED